MYIQCTVFQNDSLIFLRAGLSLSDMNELSRITEGLSVIADLDNFLWDLSGENTALLLTLGEL